MYDYIQYDVYEDIFVYLLIVIKSRFVFFCRRLFEDVTYFQKHHNHVCTLNE